MMACVRVALVFAVVLLGVSVVVPVPMAVAAAAAANDTLARDKHSITSDGSNLFINTTSQGNGTVFINGIDVVGRLDAVEREMQRLRSLVQNATQTSSGTTPDPSSTTTRPQGCPTQLFNLMPLDNFASQHYSGGVYIPTINKVYGIPYMTNSVLIYDPATGAVDTTAISLDEGTGWFGGAVVNELIYCIPFSANPDVLVVDPHSNTTSTIRVHGMAGSSQTWFGAVVGSDNHVYGLPFSASYALEIDPVNRDANPTAIVIPEHSANEQWGSGTLGPDDRIYAAPFTGNRVLVLNTAMKVSKLILLNTNTLSWFGAVLSPNEDALYIFPSNVAGNEEADAVHVLHYGASGGQNGLPVQAQSVIDIPDGGSPYVGWIGGVLADNNKIYAVPGGGRSVLVLDPQDGSIDRVVDQRFDDATWLPGVTVADGSIVALPYAGTSSILTFSPSVLESCA